MNLYGATPANGSNLWDRTADSRFIRLTLPIRAPTCARRAASEDWLATYHHSSSKMTRRRVRETPYTHTLAIYCSRWREAVWCWLRYQLYWPKGERSNQFFCLFIYISFVFSTWFDVTLSSAEESLQSESNKKFFVFHDWGVSVYEPQNCRLLHMIQSTDIMPGTQVSRKSTAKTLSLYIFSCVVAIIDGRLIFLPSTTSKRQSGK